MKINLLLLLCFFSFAGIITVSTSSCQKSTSAGTSTTDTTHTDTTHKDTIPKVIDTIRKAKAACKAVCYVEVNNYPMINVGKYTLADSGFQMFDIAIIFAAKINYNTVTKQSVLYNNPQVTNQLLKRSTQIVPLQRKGIKVLLSILGNHYGAGISNFTSQASINTFASQVRDTVNYYGLDGVDFDDEYADYGTKGLPQANDSSFVMLISTLRKLMPNKIISFYFVGPATAHLSYKGSSISNLVDYSWNAYYGTYSVPTISGMSKANLSPAAVDLSATSQNLAQNLAIRSKAAGYGVFMCYNLSNTDQHDYLSSISNALYGTSVNYTP